MENEKQMVIEEVRKAIVELNESMKELAIGRMVGSIDKKNIVWNVKQITKMVKNGAINFDHIVQRSYVWENSRKSKLMESALLGFPVPPVWAKMDIAEEGAVLGRSNKVYVILDGKQRLTAFASFVNGEYVLEGIDPISYEDEDGEIQYVDINGLKFDELPVELQDAILSTTISVNYFDDLDADGQRELFNRLNNGKPLSTKSKTLANCKDLVNVMDIGKHPLFDKMLSEKARANKNYVSIIYKMWCMINLDITEVSFDSKTFNALVESTVISEEDRKMIDKVLDFADELYDDLYDASKKIAKKFVKETNFISMIPFMVKVMEEGLDDDQFFDFIWEFYDVDEGTSKSVGYNTFSTNGTAKHINVLGRHEAINEEFVGFFDLEDEEEEDDEEEDEIFEEEIEEVKELGEEDAKSSDPMEEQEDDSEIDWDVLDKGIDGLDEIVSKYSDGEY